LLTVDAGANGELSYVIAHGNEAGLFAVDQRTGALTVASPGLDSVSGRSVRLVLTVQDAGSPSRMTVVDLVVVVNATDSDTSSSAAAKALARQGDNSITGKFKDTHGIPFPPSLLSRDIARIFTVGGLSHRGAETKNRRRQGPS